MTVAIVLFQELAHRTDNICLLPQLVEHEEVGECGSECRTIARACEEVKLVKLLFYFLRDARTAI